MFNPVFMSVLAPPITPNISNASGCGSALRILIDIAGLLDLHCSDDIRKPSAEAEFKRSSLEEACGNKG